MKKNNIMSVTKSQPSNIQSPSGNSLAVFIDGVSGIMMLKDVNGQTEPISTYVGTPSPFEFGACDTAIIPVKGSNIGSGNYSTVGGGQCNTVSGYRSTIGGGLCNNVSGNYSSVVGGRCNTASGYYSTVGGGSQNTSSAFYSIISGGSNNTASGFISTIGGGGGNTASGNFSAIGGGYYNTASGIRSSILGGQCNDTCSFADSMIIGSNICATQACTTFTNCISAQNLTAGCFVSVAPNGVLTNSPTIPYAGSIMQIGAGTGSTERCGLSNQAVGNYSVVTGGKFNCAFGNFSTISGGIYNCTYSDFDTIAGGQNNITLACQSIIGGGSYNTTSGNDSTISGGKNNTSSSNFSIVGGGTNNTASALYSIVGGGSCNIASAEHSFVGGGYKNNAICIHSVISGGAYNCVSSSYSSISGGCFNLISGYQSSIVGGHSNCISNKYGFIGNGYINNITGTTSFIGGGRFNTISGNYGVIGGGDCNTASGAYSFIGSGRLNIASSSCSFIGGGNCNTASGVNSGILGGQYNNTCTFADSMIIGSNICATQACTTFMNCASVNNLTVGCLVSVGANKVLENAPFKANYGLFAQTANSVPVTATAVESSLIGSGVGTLSVPANAFSVGDSFDANFTGVISAVGTATLEIRVKTLSGALLMDTGIIAMDATTAKIWTLGLQFTIRQIGTTGVASISSGGLFSYIKNSGTQFEGFTLSTVNTTTFDTTINNTLVVTAQWNTNNAGNSIFSRNFVLNKIY
jgi:hypothetical protein